MLDTHGTVVTHVLAEFRTNKDIPRCRRVLMLISVFTFYRSILISNPHQDFKVIK